MIDPNSGTEISHFYQTQKTTYFQPKMGAEPAAKT